MLNSLLKEWQYFLLALGFFTRIPVPIWHDYQDDYLNHAAKYFPLIGVIVGCFGALGYLVSHQYLPNNIAILISMAITIYLTGAFHEDGLADSVDGLGGGWNRAKILEIMVDSRLGTYGAAALFFALFAKFYLLQAMQTGLIPLALVLGHTLSRLSSVWMMATLEYAKPSGKAKPLASKLSVSAICLANILGLLTVFGAGCFLSQIYAVEQLIQLVVFSIVPMLVSWCWWRFKVKRWLGGYTGDILGAVQQITELAFYVGFILWALNL